jgi:phosphoribosylaminoimidazole-succinocarboxamide synthase
MINDYHIYALSLANEDELDKISSMSFKINEILSKYFDSINIELIDFKLEFGRTSDGTIILADEISPDTCRYWDKNTGEKLDKDRFRRDLGNVEGAYQEILKRTLGNA